MTPRVSWSTDQWPEGQCTSRLQLRHGRPRRNGVRRDSAGWTQVASSKAAASAHSARVSEGAPGQPRPRDGRGGRWGAAGGRTQGQGSGGWSPLYRLVPTSQFIASLDSGDHLSSCEPRGWTSLSSCEPRQDDASQTPESSGFKLVAGENVPRPHSLCGFCPREQKCGLARVKRGGQGPRQPVSSLCLHAHRKGPRAGRSASLSAPVRAPGPWPELQHRPAFLRVCPAPAREGGHVRSPSAACPGLACCRLGESQEGTCVVPHGLAR